MVESLFDSIDAEVEKFNNTTIPAITNAMKDETLQVEIEPIAKGQVSNFSEVNYIKKYVSKMGRIAKEGQDNLSSTLKTLPDKSLFTSYFDFFKAHNLLMYAGGDSFDFQKKSGTARIPKENLLKICGA